MSAVIAVPELMEAAATDLATIGETLNTAHLAAATPTVAVLPAAADEVSAGIAHLFSGYGQEYQKLAGQAAASYEEFVRHVTASASAYASAEAANTALLQPLTDPLVNSINAAADQLANLWLTNIVIPFIQNILIPAISILIAILGPVVSLAFLIPSVIVFIPFFVLPVFLVFLAMLYG